MEPAVPSELQGRAPPRSVAGNDDFSAWSLAILQSIRLDSDSEEEGGAAQPPAPASPAPGGQAGSGGGAAGEATAGSARLAAAARSPGAAAGEGARAGAGPSGQERDAAVHPAPSEGPPGGASVLEAAGSGAASPPSYERFLASGGGVATRHIRARVSGPKPCPAAARPILLPLPQPGQTTRPPACLPAGSSCRLPRLPGASRARRRSW